MITRVKNLQLATAFSSNFEQDIDTTTGLLFGHVGGSVHNEGVLQTIAAGTVTVPIGESIIYLDTEGVTALIAANVDPDSVTNRWLPIYIITANGEGILTVQDVRSFTSAAIDITP